MFPDISKLLPALFPPSWASGWGEDEFGLFAELHYQGVIQRLRWILPGTFWMGSPEDELDRHDNEGPRHEVTISRGFWLADTACTQALWQAVMNYNPSRFKDAPQQPVETVSWHDVQEFLHRLQNLLPGCQVDLPSEAEWEYACRAGTTTPFSFGPQITPQQVNYNGYYSYAGNKQGVYRAKTVPVKGLHANAWGLYEMHGNVWEWCKDSPRVYDEQAQTDPLGPMMQGDEEPRAVRGGSLLDRARGTRSAGRLALLPGDAVSYQGFRFCLRPIKQVKPGITMPQDHATAGPLPNVNQAGLQEKSSLQRGDRIHKILAKAGLGSLREIEDMIRCGRVIKNGQRVQLADHCLPTDRVEIDGKLIDLTAFENLTRVIMYYKSTGEVVSRRDPEEREVVFDNLPQLLQARWIAVGRMEIKTEGLMLFTTNGKLADRLMKTSRLSAQKYKVCVKGPVDEAMIKRLQSGIMLEDGWAQSDIIQYIPDKVGTKANHWFYITLKDQRNRVVQRLFESQWITVIRLIRISFADLELPKDMKPRTYIQLSPEQVAALMESVGLQGTESDSFN